MFERIGRSFTLVRTSWDILMDDRKLLVFPVLSGIVTIFVILTFILPVLVSGFLGNLALLFVLFLFYLASYFVVIFFNTALISCVNAKLNGKQMSVGEGISAAARHLPAIIGWAALSATVGLVLNLLEERTGFIGDIVLAFIGAAWSIATFFVVPVLAIEDKGVTDSLKESVTLIKNTWGESIVGSVSIGIIFVLIGFVAAAISIAALMFIGGVAAIAAIAFFLLVVVVLAVVYSAMQGIFVTALYSYAKTGTVPSEFGQDLIQNAFQPKQPGSGNVSGGTI